MFIEDRLYGKFEIDSPILIELIASSAIQRLKGIAQFGVPDKYYPMTGYSRFEHSVGVMLLLKMLGADEEEQVAGLLHDASHLAFSHVADFLLGTASQENWQDLNHVSRLEELGIRQVLEKYGLSFEKIADRESFGLLERPIPDLCADRVDYALREFAPELTKSCLESLLVIDGRMAFADTGAAKTFALSFLERQKNNWGGTEAVNRYSYFAKALKIAAREGLMSFEDFKQDDAFVLEKIRPCQDQEFLRYMQALEKKSWADLPMTGHKHLKKFRYVDPLCRTTEDIKRLSAIDYDFQHMLEKELKKQGQGVPHVII